MRYSLLTVIFCVLASACTPPGTAQQPVSSQQSSTHPPNLPFNTGLSCDELHHLLDSPDNSPDKITGGFAMIWLDGYYSARVGITEVPAAWTKTLGQSLAANCAVDVNRSHPVLEVIALVHREYGSGNH
jgi:hypothetical protein